MADLLQTPAAAGILPPDPGRGIATLSGILGIKQQQQALETGQATQRSAQAKATVDTQGANENQNLARLLADPVGNGIVDGDGNPTKNAQSIVMRAAPTTGADAYEKVVNAAKSKVEFNGAVNNLRGSERDQVVNALSGPAADPDATYDTLKSTLGNLVESKKGTPVYDDYKTIADTTLQGLDHVTNKQKQTGQVIPVGQEAWRTGALNLARGSLGVSGVVGAGGIATPQQATTGAGTVNRVPVTGALTAPPGAAPGSPINPTPVQVAGQTKHEVGAADIDVQRASEVSNLQKQSSAMLPLTNEIDRLAHEISSSKIAGAVTAGLKNLGFADLASARTQLEKDLGLVKGPLAASAGSDSRAAAILEGYPTAETPEKTTHAAMDYIRGSFRQNVARGQLLSRHGVNGFAAADDEMTRSADPLVHEAAALPPGKPGGFYSRNFGSPEEAQKFKDRVDALKKHTAYIGGSNGPTQ
jgi:hypothetical protein